MINEQYIKEHTLKECLTAFKGAGNGNLDAKNDNLTTEFRALAQKMLYGGYLKVGDDYEIYITKVEFYYHEEDKSDTQITDQQEYLYGSLRCQPLPGMGHGPAALPLQREQHGQVHRQRHHRCSLP